MFRRTALLLAAACLLQPHLAGAQGMTGDLKGTVKDAQGGVLPRAVVRVSSPALIGGQATRTTDGKGQSRFLALPPDSTSWTSSCRGSRHIAQRRIPASARAPPLREPLK